MVEIVFPVGLSPHTGEAEGEGKKRKRGAGKEKKPRDPNAPKRPPSAYLLYQNEFRKEIKEKNPEMSYPQVLQESSKMWAELSPQEKKPYQDATDLAKAEFEKAKAEYLEAHPAAAAAFCANAHTTTGYLGSLTRLCLLSSKLFHPLPSAQEFMSAIAHSRFPHDPVVIFCASKPHSSNRYFRPSGVHLV